MSQAVPVIAPLRALRYREQAGSLSSLLAPPFDVISTEEQAWLYQQHEHNIVRLEYAMSYPGDTPQGNCYTRAAATLRQWREEGVLAQDERPALYPYRHSFTFQGERRQRLGCFCLVRLSEFSQGVVLPHEDTHSEAKADRRQLLRACQAQISPIFSLFREGRQEASAILGKALGEEPIARAELGQERHELWQIADPTLIRRFAAVLGAGPFFIADGHHRYETALAFRDEMRQAHPEAGELAAYNYALMMLVAMDDPGLVILPATRMLKLGARPLALLQEAAAEYFQVQAVALVPGAIAPRLEARSASGQPAFAIVTAQGSLLLTLKPTVELPRDPRGRLEVSVLHALLLDGVLAASRERQLSYAMGELEPCRMVESGRYDAAVFLNAPGAEQVLEVACAGQRMPHKSTYFYPKPATGLVISPISAQERAGLPENGRA